MTAANGLARTRFALDEEEGFARLIEVLRPKLVLVARQRGFTDAEDVVQETLIAAMVGFRRGKFLGQSAIDTWIYGILRNKILDHERFRFRESKHLVSIEKDSRDAYQTELSSHSDVDPDLLIAVEEVLSSLPARHWLVLVLNWREGLKTREIAPLIGLSSGRTGAILAEAKEMLRQGVAAGEENPSRVRLIK